MLLFPLHGVLGVWSSRVAWKAVGSSLCTRKCRGCRLLSIARCNARKMHTSVRNNGAHCKVRSISNSGSSSSENSGSSERSSSSVSKAIRKDSLSPSEIASIVTHYNTSPSLNQLLSSDVINTLAQQLAQNGDTTTLWRMLADQLGCAFHSGQPDVASVIVGHLYTSSRVSLHQSAILIILRTCLKNNMQEGWAWYRALRTLSNQTLFSAYGSEAKSLLPFLIKVAGLTAELEESAIRARQVFLDEILPTNFTLAPPSLSLLLQLMLPLPRQQFSDLMFPYVVQIGFTPSIEICEAFVAQICAGEMFDLVPEALKLLMGAGRPSVSFYNNTLKLYTKHRHAAVNMILEHMKANQTTPSLDILSIMLPADLGYSGFMELFALGESSLCSDPRKPLVSRFCGDLVTTLYKQGAFADMNRVLSQLSSYGADRRLVYTALCQAYATAKEHSALVQELYSHISLQNRDWSNWLQHESFTVALVRALVWGKGFGPLKKVLSLLKKDGRVDEEVLALCHVCDVCAVARFTEELRMFFDLLRAHKGWHESPGWRKFRLSLLEGVDLEDIQDFKTFSGKLEVMSLLVVAPPSRFMLPFLHSLISSFMFHFRLRHTPVWNALSWSYFRYLALCRSTRLSITIDTLNLLLDCLILDLETALVVSVESPQAFVERQQQASRLAQLALAACQWVLDRAMVTIDTLSVTSAIAASSTTTASTSAFSATTSTPSTSTSVFFSPLPKSSVELADQLRLVGSSEILSPSQNTWFKTITVLSLARSFLPKEIFSKYREVIRKEAFNTQNSREEGMEGLGLLYTVPAGAARDFEKEDALEAVQLFREFRSRRVQFSDEELVCGMLTGLRQIRARMWAAEPAREIYELAKSHLAELRNSNPPLIFTRAIFAELIQLAGRDTLLLGQVFAVCQQEELSLDLSLCVALVQAGAQPSDVTTMLRYIRAQDVVDSVLLKPDFAPHIQIDSNISQVAAVGSAAHRSGSEFEPSLEQRLRSTGDGERLVAYFSDLEPFKIENNKEPRSNDKRFSFRHIWSTHLKGSLSEP